MRLTQVFYFLAGSSEVVIEDCPEAERNYHTAIGGFVLITAIVASLSGGYALYTVFGSVIPAILFGVFWGCVIGAIDRFIVMTVDLTSQGGRARMLFAAGSRLVLATFVAVVVARPLELRIFAPEIGEHLAEGVSVRAAAQIAALREEIAANERDYEGTKRLAADEASRAALSGERDLCLLEQARLRDEVHGECDGTSGTRRVGVGPICDLKKADHDDVKARCDDLVARLAAADEAIAELRDANDEAFAAMRAEGEARIHAVEQATAQELAKIDAGDSGSLLTRLEALHALSLKSGGMAWAVWFVTALFVLIEAMPVGLKLLVAGRGTYARRLEQDEDEAGKRHRIERRHRERQRMYHRQTVSTIARAVRDQQRGQVLDTIATGADVVANDVNLELRRRTEVTSVDSAQARTAFPPGRDAGYDGDDEDEVDGDPRGPDQAETAVLPRRIK